MALVRTFGAKQIARPTLHLEIEAEYAVFERDGRTLLQIDTYGSSEREKPGKQSRTIQLDQVGAANLFEILKREFNFA